ncbi:MAG: hypothetical protein WC843_04960 [Candidatus Gracilibacteria bacterium]|jgi:serine/threonine protein phosphatase PrpC
MNGPELKPEGEMPAESAPKEIFGFGDTAKYESPDKSVWAATNKGGRELTEGRKEANEDGYRVVDDKFLAVGDGVGGGRHGAEVCELVLRTLDPTENMNRIFHDACVNMQRAKFGPREGTMLALAREYQDGDEHGIEVGHVGDAKIHVLDAETGEIIYASEDQSSLNDVVNVQHTRKEVIKAIRALKIIFYPEICDDELSDLTDEQVTTEAVKLQIKNSPTSYVNPDKLQFEAIIKKIPVANRPVVVLLSSDGFHGIVSDTEISEYVKTHKKDAPKKLYELAMERQAQLKICEEQKLGTEGKPKVKVGGSLITATKVHPDNVTLAAKWVG